MASSEQTSPKPNDLVMESLRDACYPMEGSIDSVQLVADTTREDAIERFARDVGVDEGEVRCTQTAARILTASRRGIGCWLPIGTARPISRCGFLTIGRPTIPRRRAGTCARPARRARSHLPAGGSRCLTPSVPPPLSTRCADRCDVRGGRPGPSGDDERHARDSAGCRAQALRLLG